MECDIFRILLKHVSDHSRNSTFSISVTVPFRKMLKHLVHTAQKIKFSINDFFIKCDQTSRKLWIRSQLLEKFWIVNFIFRAPSKDETIKTSYLSHDNFIFTVYGQRLKNVRFSFFMVIVKVHLSSWIEQKISSTKL